uniref:CBF domain-containing protein n=1 Tax=Strongyloides papillosus TaxID=174720 RepID=A0A0N5BR12_STREA
MVKVKKKVSKVGKEKTKTLKKSENVSNLLINHKQGTKWYENTFDDKAKSEDDLLSGDALKKIEEKANDLWKKDCNNFNKRNNISSTTINWMETVLSKGTFSDKITAMQLCIKKSPVHSIDHLNGLVYICEKKKLRNLFMSFKLLRDMFLDDLLPPDRKLVSFSMRPLAKINEISKGNETVANKMLVMWKFESELKDIYYKFLKSVDSCSTVAVENIATQSSSLLMDFLMARSERESEILSMIINQLGNPHRKNASYIIVLLKKLIEKHPSMKEVVIKEVELLLFRKNIPIKTQQYAVGFLTQIFLNVVEKNVAQQLLKIYFCLIKTLLAKENTECKLMDLVIVGVYRVLPFAKDKINEMSKEIESLYKLISVAKYSISMRILRLVFKSSSIMGTVSDQFYSALYRFMLRDHPSKYQKDLCALVYDAVKHDLIFERQRAFIKRLFQIALVGLPELAAEALYTVGRLVKINKKLVSFSEENSLYEFKKDEVEDEIIEEEEMDDEEVYYDYDVDEKGNVIKIKADIDQTTVQKSKLSMKIENDGGKDLKITKYYSPFGTHPQYSKAHLTNDIELTYLKKHYHPVVSDFASKLISGKEIFYNDDFKEDLSIIRFLDRFAFQKSKKNSKGSIKCLAVDSEEYITAKPSKIPVDEAYIHRYACMKYEKSKKNDDDEDRYSINSDEFDDIIKNFNDQIVTEEFNEEDEYDDDDFDVFEKELEEKQQVGKKRKRTSDAEKSLYQILNDIDTEEADDSEEEVGFDDDDDDFEDDDDENDE